MPHTTALTSPASARARAPLAQTAAAAARDEMVARADAALRAETRATELEQSLSEASNDVSHKDWLP